MEIERKFVPEALPEDLSGWTPTHMTQGYLCTAPVVRVRKEGGDFVLTCKGSGSLAREELNLPLTEESFESLLKKCEGRIIEKTRYRAPVETDGALTAELDIFEGELKGLVLLEVEFPSVEAARRFVPPAWYGRDVTELPEYSNASLSRGITP